MSTIRRLAPHILLIAVFVAGTYALTVSLERDSDLHAPPQEIAHQQSEEPYRELITALLEQMEQLQRQLTDLSESHEALRLELALEPWDVPLSLELQRHVHRESRRAGVHPELIMRVMWHESGCNPTVADNKNHNGSVDRGPMQINSVNWAWLLELGYDVSDPYDNISAGIYILSGYLNKYPAKQALAAYAAGESGMLQGGGSWFAEEIIQQQEPRRVKDNPRADSYDRK